MELTITFYFKAILLILLGFCARTDIKEQRIPNVYLIRGVSIRVLLLLPEVSVSGAEAIKNFIIKIVVCFFIFIMGILIRKITQNGIGMGDIKLMMVMYLYLTPETWVTAVFLGILFGIIHIGIVRIKKKGCKKIPFAPDLFIAAVIVCVLQ